MEGGKEEKREGISCIALHLDLGLYNYIWIGALGKHWD